eukprot:SAG31_NODE_46468_length_254_cov_0.883871_1_plen_25_part_10
MRIHSRQDQAIVQTDPKDVAWRVEM